MELVIHMFISILVCFGDLCLLPNTKRGSCLFCLGIWTSWFSYSKKTSSLNCTFWHPERNGLFINCGFRWTLSITLNTSTDKSKYYVYLGKSVSLWRKHEKVMLKKNNYLTAVFMSEWLWVGKLMILFQHVIIGEKATWREQWVHSQRNNGRNIGSLKVCRNITMGWNKICEGLIECGKQRRSLTSFSMISCGCAGLGQQWKIIN